MGHIIACLQFEQGSQIFGIHKQPCIYKIMPTYFEKIQANFEPGAVVFKRMKIAVFGLEVKVGD